MNFMLQNETDYDKCFLVATQGGGAFVSSEGI